MRSEFAHLIGVAFLGSTLSAHAFYPPALPGDPDPGIGSIRFFPEQYPNPPDQSGFSYTAPSKDGTDVFNGRDASGNRIYVFDSFTTATTVGSAQPHFFGGWLNNNPGTIAAIHIQLYADNAGQFGTLLYAGSYAAGAAYHNGPSYLGPSVGPAVDPSYDRNRDFGTRNELYGARRWFDGTALSAPAPRDVIQIATTPSRANGFTCCGPLADNSVFWIGFSVDSSTGTSFGAATNFVPSSSPFVSAAAAAFSAPVTSSVEPRYARSVVINDAAVAALEQALQTLSDPNATPELKAVAQAAVSSDRNVVALLANTNGAVPPLSADQQAVFGITQTQFNAFAEASGDILIDGQNVNLALAPVPLPAPLLLLATGLVTLSMSRHVRRAIRG